MSNHGHTNSSNYVNTERRLLPVINTLNGLLRKILIRTISNYSDDPDLILAIKEMGMFTLVDKGEEYGAKPYVAYTCVGLIYYFEPENFFNNRNSWYSLLSGYTNSATVNTRPYYLLRSKLESDKIRTTLP